MAEPREYDRTPRTTVERLPDRARYDRGEVHAILDEAFLCHVGFVVDGTPRVLPMVYGRAGDAIYLHGSTANRMLRTLRDGGDCCVTVTHVDGLVLARSAFHHSVNYRSVVVFGKATEVTDAEEKLAALRTVVDHVFPDRWKEIRGPNLQEFHRTLVLRVPVDEASAKVRGGPPVDEEGDYQLGCWAGVIPMQTLYGPPVDDPRLEAGVEAPDHVSAYSR